MPIVVPVQAPCMIPTTHSPMEPGGPLGDSLGGGFSSSATLVMELPDATGGSSEERAYSKDVEEGRVDGLRFFRTRENYST